MWLFVFVWLFILFWWFRKFTPWYQNKETFTGKLNGFGVLHGLLFTLDLSFLQRGSWDLMKILKCLHKFKSCLMRHLMKCQLKRSRNLTRRKLKCISSVWTFTKVKLYTQISKKMKMIEAWRWPNLHKWKGNKG